jgi:hypothetical protein
MRWTGPIDCTLVTHLTGLDRSRNWSAAAFHDPVGWALGVLGLEDRGRRVHSLADRGRRRHTPSRVDVQRRFRELVRHAHPDHGGSEGEAARRIGELAEARRILLAV